MDKKLQFAPLHYKEKLTDYSKDTIDFKSINGFFKYKINKSENPIVVEAVEDYFKIYVSTKPEVTLWRVYPRRSDPKDLFYAQVCISEQGVEIKIFWKKFYKIAYFTLGFLFLGTSLIPAVTNDFVIFPIFPFLIIIFIYITFSKRLFKTFVINFMNAL